MKFRASLLWCKVWLQRNRNIPAIILMNPMRVKMLCHYCYYAVTDNYRSKKQIRSWRAAVAMRLHIACYPTRNRIDAGLGPDYPEQKGVEQKKEGIRNDLETHL